MKKILIVLFLVSNAFSAVCYTAVASGVSVALVGTTITSGQASMMRKINQVNNLAEERLEKMKKISELNKKIQVLKIATNKKMDGIKFLISSKKQNNSREITKEIEKLINEEEK